MAKKEAKKENNKNKKSFWKDFKAELKKVNWPTPKQLVNNTTAVVMIVIITAAIVFVLDLAFETLNKYGVDQIKGVIGNQNTTAEENTSNEVEQEETQENTEETSNEEGQPETENENVENKTE